MLVSELPKNIVARANRTIDQYHRCIKKLHLSDYAETIIGSKGGKETKEWPYKGKMRTFPRIYKNSGAIVEKKSGKWIITLFSHLGKIIDTIPLIPENAGKDDYCESFGALYCITKTRHSIQVRNYFDKNGRVLQIVGYIVNGTIEHGKTFAEAKNNLREKLKLAEKKKLEQKQSARQERFISLASRLCKNLRVYREDSKLAGNCVIGTERFIENKHYVGNYILLGLLPKNNYLVDKVKRQACQRLAISRKV